MEGVNRSMSREEFIDNMILLVNRYVPDRSNRISMIKENVDSTRYVLSEIDKYKRNNYTSEDLTLLKDIGFYYL